jgi:hypothetical protein
MVTEPVLLEIEGGEVIFDAEGISFTPRYLSTQLRASWKNIMFVSPVPAVTKNNGVWQTFQSENGFPLVWEPLTAKKLALGLPFYSLSVAIANRSEFIASASFLTRFRLRLGVMFHPLLNSEMRQDPSTGVVILRLQKRWIQQNGENLIAALDAIEEHSRFDQLDSDGI